MGLRHVHRHDLFAMLETGREAIDPCAARMEGKERKGKEKKGKEKKGKERKGKEREGKERKGGQWEKDRLAISWLSSGLFVCQVGSALPLGQHSMARQTAGTTEGPTNRPKAQPRSIKGCSIPSLVLILRAKE